MVDKGTIILRSQRQELFVSTHTHITSIEFHNHIEIFYESSDTD